MAMSRGQFRKTTTTPQRALKPLKAVSAIPPGGGGSPAGILASPEGVPAMRKGGRAKKEKP